MKKKRIPFSYSGNVEAVESLVVVWQFSRINEMSKETLETKMKLQKKIGRLLVTRQIIANRVLVASSLLNSLLACF